MFNPVTRKLFGFAQKQWILRIFVSFESKRKRETVELLLNIFFYS